MQITNVVENVNNEHIFTLYKYYIFWHIKMFCSTIIWFYELLNFFFVIQYLQYNCIWNMILHVYIIETNTLFTVLINFGFEIRFNIKIGLRSHLFWNKCVSVLPNSNHLGVVIRNPIWTKPVVWTQKKIYFRIKSITHVCRRKKPRVYFALKS